MGASWEALEAKGNPQGREVGTLLVVAGAEIEERQGGGGAEQQEQWEDSLATLPKWESELSQINRSVREVCVGVVSLV